jgi:TATA-box binding protein (TBP) (component of TFIID and TFIIIB)
MADEITGLTFIAPKLTFSELRISTMTTTAHVGTTINLDNIYAQIPIIEYWDLNYGVLKMEFKGNTKGTSFKDIMLKAKDTKKSFFNQATLVIRNEISPLNWKEINVKLFRNGGIQMTGVRSMEMSRKALQWLIRHLTETCTTSPVFATIPVVSKEQIQLINTDFSIGAKVRRDVLHRILSDTYKLNSSYESAIYQGVKTKYFYNSLRPAGSAFGICPCNELCKGTGNGNKIGECKKITISPFQTGQIIITGARTIEQILEAYVFIKDVFTRHADEVLRKVYVLPAQEENDTNTVTTTKTVKTPRIKTGWIQHPCPRNVFKVKKQNEFVS